MDRSVYERLSQWSMGVHQPTLPARLKPLGHNISRRFTVAYAIHSRSEPPPILTALGAQSVWSHDLPQDLKGTVYRVPDSSWKTPTGELLSKDPLDG